MKVERNMVKSYCAFLPDIPIFRFPVPSKFILYYISLSARKLYLMLCDYCYIFSGLFTQRLIPHLRQF